MNTSVGFAVRLLALCTPALASLSHAAPDPGAPPAPGAALVNAPLANAPWWALREHDAARPRARYDGQAIVRVTARTPAQSAALMRLADEVWSHSPPVTGPIDLRATPARLALLREYAQREGLGLEVLVPDLQAQIDAERAAIDAVLALDNAGWYQTFRPLAEITARLDTLAGEFPAMASVATIGASIQNRPIRALTISGPSVPGNAASDRPQVLLNATQHAREWISTTTCLFIAEHLLRRYSTDPRVRTVMDRVQFIVVPMANPDGYEFTWSNDRYWRKNRRANAGGSFGVDLNRNWELGWGGGGSSGTPTSDTYRGTAPWSEPETRALRDLTVGNPRLRGAIDFHSYGQLILSPYGYTSALPPDNPTFVTLNTRLRDAILGYSAFTYTAGPSFATLYQSSGRAGDWYYGQRLALEPARPLFCWNIELRGTDFVIATNQIVPTGEEAMRAVLTLAEYVGLPLRFSFPDGLPALAAPGAPTEFRVTIDAGIGTLQPGSPALFWRVGTSGAFTQAALTPVSGSTFRATIPAQPCGGAVQYYVRATTTTGQQVAWPDRGATEPLQARVATSVVTFNDTGSSATGWTIGAPGDTASQGVWQLGTPTKNAAQPAGGATGATCWITTAAGSVTTLTTGDVDGGATTLTSPRFSAITPQPFSTPRVDVSYARWFSNNLGAEPETDTLVVRVSSDDGATWTTLETVNESRGEWVRVTLPLPAGVTPTDRMRLRVVASDPGADSVVEAGLDDVRVVVSGCACPPDLNSDGELTFDDIQLFVSLYNTGDARADFNNDGEWTFDDIQLFVQAYNGGC